MPIWRIDGILGTCNQLCIICFQRDMVSESYLRYGEGYIDDKANR